MQQYSPKPTAGLAYWRLLLYYYVQRASKGGKKQEAGPFLVFTLLSISNRSYYLVPLSQATSTRSDSSRLQDLLTLIDQQAIMNSPIGSDPLSSLRETICKRLVKKVLSRLSWICTRSRYHYAKPS